MTAAQALPGQLRDLQAWGLIPWAFPPGALVRLPWPVEGPEPLVKGTPWEHRIVDPEVEIAVWDLIDWVDLDDPATVGALLSVVRVFHPYAHTEYEDGEPPGPEWIVWVHTKSGQGDAGCSDVSEGDAVRDAIDRIWTARKKERDQG